MKAVHSFGPLRIYAKRKLGEFLSWGSPTTACTRRPCSVPFMNLDRGAGDAGRYASV
jgi:hypothetical protein